MIWRLNIRTRFGVALLLALLTTSAVRATVIYSFNESASNTFSYNDPGDYVEFTEQFQVAVPQYLALGTDTVSIPNAPQCMGGTVDSEGFGGVCTLAIFEVSGNTVTAFAYGCFVGYGQDLATCLNTRSDWDTLYGGGTFTIVPGKDGTYTDPTPETPFCCSDISRSATLTIETIDTMPEPSSFGLVLLSLMALVAMIAYRGWKRNPGVSRHCLIPFLQRAGSVSRSRCKATDAP